MAAGLEDAAVLLDRGVDGPALGDRVGQRLFAVDVLAGIGGGDADQAVPVVGRADADGVDVLSWASSSRKSPYWRQSAFL